MVSSADNERSASGHNDRPTSPTGSDGRAGPCRNDAHRIGAGGGVPVVRLLLIDQPEETP